ncbi:hypothetical protein MKX03_032042, partial [Papaver bracteatum]
MTSPRRSTNRKENSSIAGPSLKKAKTLGSGKKRCVSKRPSAVRDWPHNFLGAAKADMVSTPNADAGTGNVGGKKTSFVAISDDEVGNINHAADP